MVYVEVQRVLRALKWTAIVLAVLGAFIVVSDAWLLNAAATYPLTDVKYDNGMRGYQIVQRTPPVHIVLPDGTHRTIVDDRKDGVLITIDDRGYFGKHFELLERPYVQKPDFMSAGPLQLTVTPVKGGTLTVFDSNKPEDFLWHTAFGGIVALIFATLLGAPFARENDGHLEVAMTKPISRTSFALRTMLVDLAGIVAAFVLAIVVLFVSHAVEEAPGYQFNAYDLPIVVLCLAGSFAWYAMLSAATASMKRGYGAVLGVAWPAALLILFLAKTDLGGSQLAVALHWIAQPFSWLLPLNYVPSDLPYTAHGVAHGALTVAPYSEIPALFLLLVVYGAFAVLQWRRVEA